MKLWPFTVISDDSRPKVEVEYKGETKTFYPEEISSMVLLKMKEIAEAYLGKVKLYASVYPNNTFWHLMINILEVCMSCIQLKH